MKHRLAIEWLWFIACYVVAFPGVSLIEGKPLSIGDPISAAMLGIPLYLAIGAIRLTIASLRLESQKSP